MTKGTLFLLPSLLADTSVTAVLPDAVIECARELDYFLVENAKSARAFLKAAEHPRPIASLTIIEIGHAPDSALIDQWLAPLQAGRSGAIVSEAGCPCIADPGATIVSRAHELQLKVQPLVGPSSILLALMASGLLGQRFRFVGYLPQAAPALNAELRQLEAASRQGETQLFIETPYRNERLFEILLSGLQPSTRLSIAVDLTSSQEAIKTLTVAQWRALPTEQRPALHKTPVVFSLLAATKP